jgi:hypothetical protein
LILCYADVFKRFVMLTVFGIELHGIGTCFYTFDQEVTVFVGKAANGVIGRRDHVDAWFVFGRGYLSFYTTGYSLCDRAHHRFQEIHATTSRYNRFSCIEVQ